MMTFVEVEVDTETGLVVLRRVVNATDVGQIIDPPGLEGQINGCLGSGGIDNALFEETILDRTTGHILNANLIDYKWRTFPDLPIIDNVVLETPIPSHRFKAVGVGEVATSPGPSVPRKNIRCRRPGSTPGSPDPGRRKSLRSQQIL